MACAPALGIVSCILRARRCFSRQELAQKSTWTNSEPGSSPESKEFIKNLTLNRFRKHRRTPEQIDFRLNQTILFDGRIFSRLCVLSGVQEDRDQAVSRHFLLKYLSVFCWQVPCRIPIYTLSRNHDTQDYSLDARNSSTT